MAFVPLLLVFHRARYSAIAAQRPALFFGFWVAANVIVAWIVRSLRAGRVAGLLLLAVTVVKLLFFGLAKLEQLYRIGATVAVAAVLLVVSFLYQKFVMSAWPPSPTP